MEVGLGTSDSILVSIILTKPPSRSQAPHKFVAPVKKKNIQVFDAED
jgi:hypothetical protein